MDTFEKDLLFDKSQVTVFFVKLWDTNDQIEAKRKT